MILTKDFKVFNSNFDFTDSIVNSINWDSNMLDLLVAVDYYWDTQDGRNKNRELTIRLKNCREAVFNMPQVFSDLSKIELQSYVFSWYTITHCLAKNNNGLLEVSIKTVDDNPRWLTAKCDEIWVEGEEL